MIIYSQLPPKPIKEESPSNLLHWITVELFEATIMLNVGFKYDEVVAHLKTLDGAEEWIECISGDKDFFESVYMAGCRRTVTKDGHSRIYYVIWLRDIFAFTDEQYCSLAHEVLHIVQFLCSMHFERDKECEFEAYTHTYIMEQCLKAIRS